MPSRGRSIQKIKTGFSLIGDVELKRKLDELPDKVFRKVVKTASRKAMAPVLKSAKAKVAKESGLLRKSLGTKSKTYKRAGVQITLVGPRTGFKSEVEIQTPMGPQKVIRDPAKYAHLVEFGTSAHKVGTGESLKKKKRKSRVREYEHPGAQPKPFMRPAFDENRDTIEQIFRTEISAGVVKVAKEK